MTKSSPQQAARKALLNQGFQLEYETAAVTLLTHSQHPGYLVRLGVTRVVVERDGQEVYRAALKDFTMERLHAALAATE